MYIIIHLHLSLPCSLFHTGRMYQIHYTRTLVFDVRATFLIPYIILAVISLTFFVKTSRCEAVDVIEFTLSK